MNKNNCKLFLKDPTTDPITKKKIIKGKSTYNSWMEKSGRYNLIKVPEKTKCSKIPLPKSNDKWTIYTMSWCGYCKATKELLNKEKQKFVEHDITNIDFITKCLSNITNNYEMFPMIFNGEEFIGGFSELKKFFFN